MSTVAVSRAAHGRRLSIGIPSFSSAPRAPCSPITNEHPHPHVHTATKPPTRGGPVLKKIRSFTSLLSRPPSRAASPAPPKKAPKPKPQTQQADADVVAAYGSAFAREVALLQLLDGGTTQRNIERVHKARAKRGLAAGVAAGAVRGPGGELFADAQEESERRGLVRGGYARARSSAKRTKHEEDDAYVTPDEDAPAWASFQPASRKRANTQHGADARQQFFSDAFAPASRR